MKRRLLIVLLSSFWIYSFAQKPIAVSQEYDWATYGLPDNGSEVYNK